MFSIVIIHCIKNSPMRLTWSSSSSVRDVFIWDVKSSLCVWDFEHLGT